MVGLVDYCYSLWRNSTDVDGNFNNLKVKVLLKNIRSTTINEKICHSVLSGTTFYVMVHNGCQKP